MANGNSHPSCDVSTSHISVNAFIGGVSKARAVGQSLALARAIPISVKAHGVSVAGGGMATVISLYFRSIIINIKATDGPFICSASYFRLIIMFISYTVRSQGSSPCGAIDVCFPVCHAKAGLTATTTLTTAYIAVSEARSAASRLRKR